MNIEEKMNITIDFAEKALNKGEMPISAYIFLNDEIISKSYTSEIADGRFLVHAELKALLQADMLKHSIPERKKMQLFTTLEPCIMCYGAALSFFLGEIYYSLSAPEDGVLSLINFNNFKSDYLKFQKPIMMGGYCINRSKGLFKKYLDIVKDGSMYSFVQEIIDNN
jgi:tRNA(adenine34) deaminase